MQKLSPPTIEKQAYFKPWDSLIYGLIALALIAFLAIGFLPQAKTQTVTALEISYQNEKAALFDLTTGDLYSYGVKGVSVQAEESSDGNTATITVRLENGGLNVLSVNKTDKTAIMQSADCSHHKDCTFMRIAKVSDCIVCAPHQLVVTPVSDFILPEGVIV